MQNSNWRSSLLLRGERGVAVMGIAMTLILLACFAGSSWLTDVERRDAATRERTDQLKALGPVIANDCRRMIASNDLGGLRRLVADLSAKLGLGSFTVAIGDNRVLADESVFRVNSQHIPDSWILNDATDPHAESGDAQLRFPFMIPNRGAGYVDLSASPVRADFSKFTSSALICAIGLCLIIVVYRRSRGTLAELEVVRGSLTSMHEGETSIAALQVDSRLGELATTWNKLLSEVDELRKRFKSAPVASVQGNRRAGGNNLEAACDAMSQGLVLVDDKMCVRFSNGAACSFLKCERGSLAGVPAADLINDAKFKEAITAIAAGKLRRQVTLEVEQTGESAGGVLRFCLRPVRRGDVDSAMIIIEDITQQRAAEKARNSFINQVTHELRTPLTNIRLYAETAIEDGETNPEVRANCLNVINQESRRLERIVSEMLSVAEIEAGSTTVRRDEVYLDVLINELQNDYRAQAADKKITLEFNLPPKLPKLEADKDKFAIALHNLIGNALKYTPEGGKVSVTVDVKDGNLVVDVADTGIGIKPEESEKIFDRFFRSADPRVKTIVGTGLGLTLAREVMRLHGGDVTVQSVLNRGTTFSATMPITGVAA